MTSNIGARFIQKRGTLGFQSGGDSSLQKLEEQVMSQVKQTFAPEFINRLDEIILFDELSKDDLSKIIDLQLALLNAVIAGRGITLRLADSARRWLLEKALQERNFGARPLKRALQRHVEDELSEALIQGSISDGCEIEIVRSGDRLTFITIGEGLPDLAASKKV